MPLQIHSLSCFKTRARAHSHTHKEEDEKSCTILPTEALKHQNHVIVLHVFNSAKNYFLRILIANPL